MIETDPVNWSDAGQRNGITLPGDPADWSLTGSQSEDESNWTVPFDIAEVPEPTVSGLVLVGCLALGIVVWTGKTTKAFTSRIWRRGGDSNPR